MNINPLYFVAEIAVYYVENKWHILTFFPASKSPDEFVVVCVGS